MLSENIKNLRTSKGLSQQELATQLNIVRQTLSKWENGLSVPDADMLIRLSNTFEVPVSSSSWMNDFRKGNRYDTIFSQ